MDGIPETLAVEGKGAAQDFHVDSFGNTTNSSGSLTNLFRYTGRDFDTESNLYYNRRTAQNVTVTVAKHIWV